MRDYESEFHNIDGVLTNPSLIKKKKMNQVWKSWLNLLEFTKLTTIVADINKWWKKFGSKNSIWIRSSNSTKFQQEKIFNQF